MARVPPAAPSGDATRFTSGSFQGFSATVAAVDVLTGRAECEVAVYGRRAPVDAELRQLEPNE